MNSASRPLLAALALALLPVGCSFVPDERVLVVAAERPGAGTTAPATLSATDVWRIVTDAALRLGYRPAETEITLSRKHYLSRWRTQVAGFGQTRRTRLDVVVEPTEDDSWQVTYYVQQQVVRDIAASMQPTEDDWDDAGQDGTTEQIFEGHLRVGFGMTLNPIEQGDPDRDPSLRRDPYKDR